MSDSLIFDDLTPIEVPVSVNGKKYTLREASEAAAATYRNAQTRCFSMGGGEMKGITGPIADTQSLLVSLCLFDEAGAAVSRELVKTWPARVAKAIFTRAQEISELKEDGDDEPAKNDPSDTVDTSA